MCVGSYFILFIDFTLMSSLASITLLYVNIYKMHLLYF